MTKPQITRQINPILKKAGVKKAALFGSVLTKKRPNDIDILIQFRAGKSLFDLVDLEETLSKKLKKKVDLITYGSLPPLIKNRVFSEKQNIL